MSCKGAAIVLARKSNKRKDIQYIAANNEKLSARSSDLFATKMKHCC